MQVVECQPHGQEYCDVRPLARLDRAAGALRKLESIGREVGRASQERMMTLFTSVRLPKFGLQTAEYDNQQIGAGHP
jgi:hypothetical protein